MLLVFTLLLGVAYPLASPASPQVALPWRADGSLVTATGAPHDRPDDAVGSALIGQARSTTTGAVPAAARPPPATATTRSATLGSNLGPENPDLVDRDRGAAGARSPRGRASTRPTCPPTRSPHRPPASTRTSRRRTPPSRCRGWPRENGLSEDEVRGLVAEHTDGRTLGFLGEPRVNVLVLNLAVRAAAGDG